jgi:hypothetical protein
VNGHLLAEAEDVRAIFIAFGLRRVRRTNVVVTKEGFDWNHGGRHVASTRADGLDMHLSPDLARLDPATRTAILAHEWGHAADFLYPGRWLDDGNEERSLAKWRRRNRDEIEAAADQIAEGVTGRPIYYAGPRTVQTLSPAPFRCPGGLCAPIRPRPVGLR